VASTKTRTRNRNRFQKMYPMVRRRPVNELVTDQETIIEVATLTYDDESAKTYNFEQLFPAVPSITAMSKDVNVNVFITSISTTQVVVETSAPYQGSVHLHAIYIG